MRIHVHPVQQRHFSGFALLFARYIAGHITEQTWQQLTCILDAEDTTEEERVALANFVNDALSEFGPHTVEVPKLDEAQEMLTQTRAA